ncbi:MAG: methyltransferase domain-containing protein [Candidatus Sulfobium sp.]|jgi:SAM-dependent methyltransferase
MDNLRELPQPFGFYRYVLKSDHLHFGLWGENQGIPMEDAQDSMFNRLLAFFPSSPATVLDVGCGLGLSAARLSQLGYNVTAIAPAPELIRYASERYSGSGVRFKALGFLDEDNEIFTADSYDVLFFQESAQYLSPLDSAIRKARLLLNNKGIVVIGDEVCYDRDVKPFTSVHMSQDFTVTLSESGFRILENEKIGEDVSPTCDFIIDQFTTRFGEIVSRFEGADVSDNLIFYREGWKKQKEWYSNKQMGYEIFVARKDSFFMRPYAESDEHDILPAFNRLFHVNRPLEHWYWKFRDNPYGSHKVALAFSDSVPLAAHYAGYPVPFYSAHNSPPEFFSMQIGDTMTSPEVRNVGLGKTGLLARTSRYFYAKFCEEGLPFIYGFNTGHIRKLGMRYLGYTYIRPVTYWVKDLAKIPLKQPGLISRLLSGFTVEEVKSIDSEWDVFFRRVSPSYRFLVRREAAYLKWRYLDCPDRVHRIFSVRRRGILIGWSVFSLRERKLIWGDALFDKRYPDSVRYLLYTVIRHFFPKAETVEGWFSLRPAWWRRLLDDAGFAVVPEPHELTPGFVIFGDQITKEALEDRFYYTWGDSDLF